MNIIVDNLLIHYELNGKGKLILMLHGWGDTIDGLSGLNRALSKNYRVLAVDLPGFGSSDAAPVAWDLDNYADFLQAALKKLKVEEIDSVIGHSNGGAVAIRAIAEAKLKPKKLVLIAASGIRNSQPLRRLTLKTIAKTGNVMTLWLPEKKRRGLRKKLYGVAGSDMLVVPTLQETFKLTVRQDVQADATKLQLPTLLIYGTNDRAVPLADGRRYHELIKGSRLEVIKGAGHFVHQEEPEAVLSLITEFIKL